MISHNLVMLPAVTILTVRVTNVHFGMEGESGPGAHLTRVGQLSTGPQHWNPTSDTSVIWTESVAL